MPHIKTVIGEGGSVVIPSRFRKALDLEPGDEVILVLGDGEVRLLTPQRAIARAQAIVHRYVPEGRSLADELLQERRSAHRRIRP